MFELNQQIEAWRYELLENDSYRATDVDELESHLTEQIENLKAGGLSEEEAFWVAQHRLGKLKQLSEEFQKVNGNRFWRARLLWLLGGYILVSLAQHVIALFNRISLLLGVRLGLGMKPILALGITINGLLLAAIAYSLFSKTLKRSSHPQRTPGLGGKSRLLVLLLVPMYVLLPYLEAAVGLWLMSGQRTWTNGAITIGQFHLIASYLGIPWSSLPFVLFTGIVFLWRSRTAQTSNRY